MSRNDLTPPPVVGGSMARMTLCALGYWPEKGGSLRRLGLGVGRWHIVTVTQAAGQQPKGGVRLVLVLYAPVVDMCILHDSLWLLRPAAGSRRSIRSCNFRFLRSNPGGGERVCE